MYSLIAIRWKHFIPNFLFLQLGESRGASILVRVKYNIDLSAVCNWFNCGIIVPEMGKKFKQFNIKTKFPYWQANLLSILDPFGGALVADLPDDGGFCLFLLRRRMSALKVPSIGGFNIGALFLFGFLLGSDQIFGQINDLFQVLFQLQEFGILWIRKERCFDLA